MTGTQRAWVMRLEPLAYVRQRGAVLRIYAQGANHDYEVEFWLHDEANLRLLREELDVVLAQADEEARE